MRIHHPLYFLLAAALLTACLKDSEDLARDTGLLPSTCGNDGARLQAQVNGSDYCAGAQVLATGDGSSVVVTGVSLTGTSLVIQVDSLATGTQAITEASNGILFMENGSSYVVAPQQPGAITITLVDTAAHALKAQFNAVLYNELNGTSRSLQGNLDVVWSTGE
jgi:hypothetical protein